MLRGMHLRPVRSGPLVRPAGVRLCLQQGKEGPRGGCGIDRRLRQRQASHDLPQGRPHHVSVLRCWPRRQGGGQGGRKGSGQRLWHDACQDGQARAKDPKRVGPRRQVGSHQGGRARGQGGRRGGSLCRGLCRRPVAQVHARLWQEHQRLRLVHREE